MTSKADHMLGFKYFDITRVNIIPPSDLYDFYLLPEYCHLQSLGDK